MWLDSTPIEDTLQALHELVQQGKVRFVGCSNFSSYQLQRAVTYARARQLSPFVSLQVRYSLLARQLEWDLRPLCRDEGVSLLCYSPLANGWLSGKINRDDHHALQDAASRVGWGHSLPKGAIRSGSTPHLTLHSTAYPHLCSSYPALLLLTTRRCGCPFLVVDRAAAEVRWSWRVSRRGEWWMRSRPSPVS